MPEIAQRRLARQKIAPAEGGSAAAVVAHLGAMQAQDYTSALWAIGLRAGVTQQAVEVAIASGEIVRTWPMRGTLHFVAAVDAHWMLELLTPRILSGAAKRAEQLGLDANTLARGRAVCEQSLGKGRQLTRPALLAAFEAAGIATGAQRGYHILWRLAQERLICFGPRVGKQPTFVLLDEWVPRPNPLARAEALRKLARRYFASHGPATIEDFVWWSGLKVTEARSAIEAAELARETIEGVAHWTDGREVVRANDEPAAHLLPAFDQYLLGYRDRSAVLEAEHSGKVTPGNNGIFMPTIVLNGRVAGVWKRVVKPQSVTLMASPFRAFTKTAQGAISASAQRYAAFLELPIEVKFGS
ncbi:MAG: winged helix DNA-binding domain-containing protein [Chthoniobacterales bacterium]